ncbi:MAG: hypothetical protein K6C97_05635 [Treponema sp.]|nr:hypothetical protein [Treponema sp.]
MGHGITFICNTCDKEYNISFGEGFLSFQCDFKKILYACPECGNWETANVDGFNHCIPEFRKEFKEMLKENTSDFCKKIIDSIEPIDLNKTCTNCGAKMKMYENLKINDKSTTPQLICKQCKSKLIYKWAYCWD